MSAMERCRNCGTHYQPLTSSAAVCPECLLKEGRVKTMGENLRLWMTVREITPVALARKAGVSPDTVRNILHSRHGTSAVTAYLIARELDITVEDLLVGVVP